MELETGWETYTSFSIRFLHQKGSGSEGDHPFFEVGLVRLFSNNSSSIAADARISRSYAMVQILFVFAYRLVRGAGCAMA